MPCWQGCGASRAHPVAHGHRHGDHRLGQQPRQHGGQGSLHAGTGDQHPGRAPSLQAIEQPLQPRHADIEQQLTGHPVGAQGEQRLAGHRQIAAAAPEHLHRTEAWIRRRQGAAQAGGGLVVVQGTCRQGGQHRRRLGRSDPGDQHRFGGGEQISGDQLDLRCTLVLSPHRLHHAEAATAIEIEDRAGIRDGIQAGPPAAVLR